MMTLEEVIGTFSEADQQRIYRKAMKLRAQWERTHIMIRKIRRTYPIKVV